MMTPLDRMILQSVQCMTCGAKYGGCDCAQKRRTKHIEKQYRRLMRLSDDELLAECAKVGVFPSRHEDNGPDKN